MISGASVVFNASSSLSSFIQRSFPLRNINNCCGANFVATSLISYLIPFCAFIINGLPIVPDTTVDACSVEPFVII